MKEYKSLQFCPESFKKFWKTNGQEILNNADVEWEKNCSGQKRPIAFHARILNRTAQLWKPKKRIICF
jgi:hypothetical protein